MKATFFILMTLPLGIFAQNGSISGKVSSEGKPLEFAVTGLSGTNFTAMSTRNGSFQIKEIPYGEYEFVATMTGYKTEKRSIKIHSETPVVINVDLFSFSGDLNEVVVTGTMKEMSRLESPIPVEVLTPKLFQKNPTPSLFESMQMVNGVQPQLNCNVCNTGDIHINGMEGPYTMITIDGMPIVSALSTVYGLSGIPNSLVNRIEVVKGPASTLYGSEAVGGLINVITKNPESAPRLSADVMATSQEEFNVDLGLRAKTKRASTLLGINYFNFQNIIDRNQDNFTDITLQHRISFFNKWAFNRKDEKLSSIAARFVYEDRWGGETQYEDKFRGTDSVYGESIYTTRYELIGVYQLPFKRESVFLQYSFNNHQQNSYYGTTPYFASQNIAFGQLYWTKNLAEGADLLVGVPLRYTYYDDNTPGTYSPDSLRPFNLPQQTWLPGLFVQTELKKNKFTTLAGLRYDYNTEHGNIFSPRLAFKYAMNDLNIFRLSLGNGYRVVNLFTEDHAALTGAREVVIVNDLQPERSWNVILNFQRSIPLEECFIGLDASAFYTYFTNKIIGDFNTDPNKIIFDNLDGYAVSQGLAFSADVAHTSGFKAILGVTWMDVFSMQKDTNRDYIRTPQLYAPKFSGNFTFSYAFKRSGVSIDYTGIVKSPMHLPVVPNDFRPESSPWFSIQNLQLTKKFKGGLEIYGGVKNILDFVPRDPILRPFDPFDKNISENNPYGYTFDPSYNYAPLQGRRYFLGIRYTLE